MTNSTMMDELHFNPHVVLKMINVAGLSDGALVDLVLCMTDVQKVALEQLDTRMQRKAQTLERLLEMAADEASKANAHARQAA